MVKKLALILCAVFLFAACANYSGDGNEFEVVGTVTDAGNQSLQVELTQIVSARGSAEGWFDIGATHRIHDNCDCDGFWYARETVGTVYDIDGNIIEPHRVQEGTCVRFEGAIRAHNEGKHNPTRPVFEEAYVIDCL